MNSSKFNIVTMHRSNYHASAWLLLGAVASFATSTVTADSNYIMLESPKGCMGRRTIANNGSDALVLLECNPEDDNVLWRSDPESGLGFNRFRSYQNDGDCLQVENHPDIVAEGTGKLGRGARLFTKPCAVLAKDRPNNVTSPKVSFQAFDPLWDSGLLTLRDRPDLCVVHNLVEPVLGESHIMLVPCVELGGPTGRVEGWNSTAVDFEYVVLDSLPGFRRGGCIGRNDTTLDGEPSGGGDELAYHPCRSDDDALQWRLDNAGRLRSKVNGQAECLQAEERPDVLQSVDNLIRGSQMYVKPCATPGSVVEDFQIVDVDFWAASAAEGENPDTLQGPLRMLYRPDLCIVHFGADPVIGESRIMLVECASLGGERAKGWEAIDPCSTPPTCNVRTFGNATDSSSNATIVVDIDVGDLESRTMNITVPTLIGDDEEMPDEALIDWEASGPAQSSNESLSVNNTVPNMIDDDNDNAADDESQF